MSLSLTNITLVAPPFSLGTVVMPVITLYASEFIHTEGPSNAFQHTRGPARRFGHVDGVTIAFAAAQGPSTAFDHVEGPTE